MKKHTESLENIERRTSHTNYIKAERYKEVEPMDMTMNSKFLAI
jgi:hypothetical protein